MRISSTITVSLIPNAIARLTVHWRSATTVILAACALLFGMGNAHANLIINGDFTSGSNAGWTGFQTANPSFPDSVEVNPSGVYGLSCYDANCYNMEVNANYTDTVTQTVSGLTTGGAYTLSFGYSGRSGYGPQELEVSFGGALLGTLYSSNSAPWTTETFTFTATGGSELLSFASESVGGSPGGGNEVTGVSLTQTVPEPRSIALLGVGVVTLALMRRRIAKAA